MRVQTEKNLREENEKIKDKKDKNWKDEERNRKAGQEQKIQEEDKKR